jgi:alanine racemase
MNDLASPLRLRLDGVALVENWQWLRTVSGAAACGAAIKADGYGLGAGGVAERLLAAGCRDFFVAHWSEALTVRPVLGAAALSVFHGVRAEDMGAALGSGIRPVLNTPIQVARWRDAAGGPCDVMVDTGMNRLGISAADIADGLLEGVQVETLMSHLASADEPAATNNMQREAFAALRDRVDARRFSLANSAGICLGSDYAFDLTRPGLALYGGVPRQEAADHIRQVVTIETQILQCRRVAPGETVGYNATYKASRATDVAIVNLGYADGYLRAFSGTGYAVAQGHELPVLGRVSMDLTAIGIDAASDLREGDWIEIGYDLPDAAMRSGLSQYELLTGLGKRFERVWT